MKTRGAVYVLALGMAGCPAAQTGNAGARFDAPPELSIDAHEEEPIDVAIDLFLEAAPLDAGGPPVPRLVAPLTTQRVSSHRPTLRWRLPDGMDAVRIEICRDRSCTQQVQTFRAEGDHARVPTALEPGIYFWRAFGQMGSTSGLTPSHVWWFRVKPTDAAVDTATGGTMDVNGDGYSDLIFSTGQYALNTGLVFLGSPSGLSEAPQQQIVGGTFPDSIGSRASAGDINGDGFVDVINQVLISGLSPNRIDIHLGTSTGVQRSPIQSINARSFFSVVDTVFGDLDRDGYVDPILSELRTIFVSTYTLFHGNEGRGVAGSSTELTSPTADRDFSGRMSSAGDVNGDGYSDLVVNDRVSSGSPIEEPAERVLLFTSSNILPLREAFAFQGFASGNAVGDVNGDGFSDIVVLSSSQVRIFHGGSSPSVFSAATLTSPGVYDHTVGDVNGDGYDDVIGLSYLRGGSSYGVTIYLGSSAGVRETAEEPLALSSNLQASVATINASNDFNGDGRADLVIVGTREVGVYYGRANEVPALGWTRPRAAGP